MKPKKIFKRMIKEHELGNEVTYVSTYENVRAVAKMLCSQPDTYIESITIEPPDWAGYDKAYLLTLSSDNLIWVEKHTLTMGTLREVMVCATLTLMLLVMPNRKILFLKANLR